MHLHELNWTTIVAAAGLLFGLIGAGCGLWGLKQSGESNALASASNATAEEALKMAKLAEERNDRLATIELEHRDVNWRRVTGLDKGVISYEHVGTTDAHDVRLTARPEGFGPKDNVLRKMQPGERIGLNLTSEVGELRRLWETTPRSRVEQVYSVPPTLPVDVRITWSSPAGKEDVLGESMRL